MFMPEWASSASGSKPSLKPLVWSPPVGKTSPADIDKVKARLKEAMEIHAEWEAEAKEQKEES